MVEIEIPSSIGDAADRMTILEIKAERFLSTEAISHVAFELSRIKIALERLGISLPQGFYNELKVVNERIFDLMDQLFGMEPSDPDYLEKVVETIDLNKLRAHLKRSINRESGSAIVEEKSYFD